MPRLLVNAEAFAKMKAYCNEAYDDTKTWVDLKEISGMGTVVPLESGDFLWDEVLLLPQTSGVAHTDFDQDKVLDLMNELIEQGQDNKLNNLHLWWHSHVKGATTPSSIDTATIDRWGEGGSSWLIAVVTNIYGEMTARLDVWNVMNNLPRVTVPLTTELYVPTMDADNRAIREDINSHVKWSTYGGGWWGKGAGSGINDGKFETSRWEWCQKSMTCMLERGHPGECEPPEFSRENRDLFQGYDF